MAKTAKKISSKRRKLIGRTQAAEAVASSIDPPSEILLRLPAKSLIQFKCVSKHWLSLISDSQFASNHARQNPTSSISGLYSNINHAHHQVKSVSLQCQSILPTLDFLDRVGDGSKTTVKHSCNGLLLCFNEMKHCIVCNPTTQKWTILPEIPCATSASSRLPCHEVGVFLTFNPSKQPYYKVVSVSYSKSGFYEIDIYSSNSCTWKHLQVTAAPQGYHRFTHKVFWNGEIHWMSRDSKIHIRFDVDAEKLTTIPGPPKLQICSQTRIHYFGESSGHLILIQLRRRSCMGFRILEMDKDYFHWNVKNRVNLRPLIPVFPKIVHKAKFNFSVLCVVKGSGEKHYALVLAIGDKVVIYNMKCKIKTLKELPILLPGSFDLTGYNYAYASSHRFIESLSPV